MQQVHGLSDAQMSAIRKIFAKSGYIGQGNPAITRHPVTPEECAGQAEAVGRSTTRIPRFEKICRASTWRRCTTRPGNSPEDAKACIDQFEFPDIPCAYPVVWVKAREAAEVCCGDGQTPVRCARMGRRLRGKPGTAGLPLRSGQGLQPNAAIERMRAAHNQADSRYQELELRPGVSRRESAPLPARRPRTAMEAAGPDCGSNTFPAGDFPDCHSPLSVYDLNGNAAEHMNLPLNESQMSSRGSTRARLHGDEGQLVHLRHLPSP